MFKTTQFNPEGYTSKALAVKAIMAEGFNMEPNDSGKGDKYHTVTEGDYPGEYCEYARPVYDGSNTWYVLVDVNRYADLKPAAPARKKPTFKRTTKGHMKFLSIKAFGMFFNVSYGKTAKAKPVKANHDAWRGEWTEAGYQRYMDRVTYMAIYNVWTDILRDPEMAWS